MKGVNLRYLSIDNALAVSGWAIWEDNTLLSHGVIKTKSTEEIGHRLISLRNELDALITMWNVDKVFFEDCQSQNNRNQQTYHKLSMVKAVILLVCADRELPHVCFSPSSWRSVLNNRFKFKFGRVRTEQKIRAKEFVKEHFQIEATEDECDAICLGYAGILEENKNKSDW